MTIHHSIRLVLCIVLGGGAAGLMEGCGPTAPDPPTPGKEPPHINLTALRWLVG
jgi:hypothetical protein